MMFCLGGCSTLAWYGQAARGQLELQIQREDIENLLAAPDTAPETRRKLELVVAAREFAEQHLALPDNGSYAHYVALDREAVVWNVVATPEFSLEAKTWCYPFVGCLAYRGYFRRQAAERLADRLAERNYDTRVSPVAAYSTLGRLRDPVTSAMLAWREHRLAGLIFHELAHQRLFISGDTTFNESYASAVERAGLEMFLQRYPQYRPETPESPLVEPAFNRLLLDFRQQLQALYASDLPAARMREAKQECFEALRHCYRRFRSCHGDGRFDAFMQRDLNNADLALVATYQLGTDAFLELLAEYDGNFERFHLAVERLAKTGREQRAAFLAGGADANANRTSPSSCGACAWQEDGDEPAIDTCAAQTNPE